MEARNFVTAREMLEKGNWLVPTMNGELRLAKPPLPTWITAVFGSWFGVENVRMLRFPAGIMGSLLVLFMYLFSFSLNKNRMLALVNSLVLASCFYVVYMGRTGTWDIYCHSFMFGAIWLLHKAWKSEKNNWGLFTGAGVLLGLSFLSKGPVAFYAVLLPFLIAYCWSYSGKIIFQKWKPLLFMLSIFIVLSFAWPVYIYFAHADELTATMQIESASWVNRHVRPFYYYWNFPIQSGVWTLLITTAVLFPFAFKKFENKRAYKFAFIWTITSVVLLSLLPEKKDRYLLPVLIPATLMAGQLVLYLHSVFKNKTAGKRERFLLGLNIWPLAVISLIFPVGVFFLFCRKGHMSLPSFIVFSFLAEAIFILLIMAWRKKDILKTVLSGVMLMILLESFIIPDVDVLLNKNPNFRDIAEIKSKSEISALNFYNIENEEFRIELVYQVGKEVKNWNPRTTPEFPEDVAFVVFSTKRPEEVFSESQQQKIEIKIIGYYDYNRSHKGKDDSHNHFKKYVSLIKMKPDYE
ncbi:MAG: ArnT family glycosyltransferase [Mangrovibacterium sp.]